MYHRFVSREAPGVGTVCGIIVRYTTEGTGISQARQLAKRICD